MKYGGDPRVFSVMSKVCLQLEIVALESRRMSGFSGFSL